MEEVTGLSILVLVLGILTEYSSCFLNISSLSSLGSVSTMFYLACLYGCSLDLYIYFLIYSWEVLKEFILCFFEFLYLRKLSMPPTGFSFV